MFNCNELKGHLRDICNGTHVKSDGRIHSLEDRRTILGRYLRRDMSDALLPEPATSHRLKSDVGTRLHKIIERDTGAPIECSECRAEVTRLDMLDIEQVVEQRQQIAKNIVERGKKKAPRFWQRWGAKLAPGIAMQQALYWVDEATGVKKKEE
jgi:hypothetical protein